VNLEGARQQFYSHSGSLSSASRQLCFAGIAVIWIFKLGADGAYALPEGLVSPLGCFIAGLALDLFQYLVAAASWHVYFREKEKSGTGEEVEFYAPQEINWVPYICFYAKAIITIVGYINLLMFLYPQ
jgi:hypothetical protein